MSKQSGRLTIASLLSVALIAIAAPVGSGAFASPLMSPVFPVSTEQVKPPRGTNDPVAGGKTQKAQRVEKVKKHELQRVHHRR